jgi:ATP-dependent Zn protease
VQYDRDAARAMRTGELASDRRCYREVGGAVCRCGGFRDSGEVAIVGRPSRTGRSVLVSGLLTLLLIVMGLGLLYAYRSQTPSIQTVALAQSIQEVNGGQVKKVTIIAGANKATLELANGDKQQTNLPDQDEVFQKALFDYNTATPSRQITIDYQQESSPFALIGSIFLSVLPVLLLGAFFVYLFRRSLAR